MFKNNHPAYFYTSDKVRIFYNTNFKQEDFDPKKTLLIFNYGLVCSNYHWKFQLPFFERNNFQILIHDYRGHFSSSKKDDYRDVSFYNITRDLFEIVFSMSKKALTKNIILIGHSMGVNISIEFARRYPDFVRGMVLISGTPYSPKDVMFNSNLSHFLFKFLRIVRDKFPNGIKTFWESSYLNPLARWIIYDGGFNKSFTDKKFVETYMKRIGELDVDLFIHLMNEMHFHEGISHFSNINSPTLIIGGDKDKLVPNYLQKIYSLNLRESEFYLVKEGSHVPQVDFPESINERIFNFIKKRCLLQEF